MKIVFVAGLFLTLVGACGKTTNKPSSAPEACSKNFIEDLHKTQKRITKLAKLVEQELPPVDVRPSDGSGYDGGDDYDYDYDYDYDDGDCDCGCGTYELEASCSDKKIAAFQSSHKDVVCTLDDKVVSTDKLVTEMLADLKKYEALHSENAPKS